MPQVDGSQLTTAELCAALEVDRRTIGKWKKAGLKPAGKRTGRGRPSDLWDVNDVRQWVSLNIRGRGIAADTDTDDEPEIDLSKYSADEITAMAARLSAKEQALSELSDAALEQYDLNRYKLLQAFWIDVCAIRARVAKDLPLVMKAKGRYVDIEEVRDAISGITTVYAASLDRVGTAVAEQCVGRTASEIAMIIDKEIGIHRQRAVDALEQLP